MTLKQHLLLQSYHLKKLFTIQTKQTHKNGVINSQRVVYMTHITQRNNTRITRPKPLARERALIAQSEPPKPSSSHTTATIPTADSRPSLRPLVHRRPALSLPLLYSRVES